jgi:O-antigen/teichoic acid export membrane protein
VRNTFAYFLAALSPQIAAFLLLPIVTKALSPGEFGELAVLQSVIAFVGAFAGLQVGVSIGRLLFDFPEEEWPKFFSTVLLAHTVIGAFVVVIAWILLSSNFGFFFAGEYDDLRAVLPIALLQMLANSINASVGYLIRATQQGVKFLVSALISVGVSAVMVVLLLGVRDYGIAGYIVATTSAAVVGMSVSIAMVRRYFTKEIDFHVLPKALSYSVPLLPHMIAGYLITLSDRLVMEKFVAIGAIGLYSLGDRFASILRFALEAFNKAESPRFMQVSVRNRQEAGERYHGIIGAWSAVTAMGFVACYLFLPDVIAMLVDEEYKAAEKFVPGLLVAYVISGLYFFAVMPIFFEKRTGYISVITITGGLLNVGMTYWLAPRVGVWAGVWSTVASMTWIFGISYLVGQKLYPTPWHWKEVGKAILIGGGALGVYELLPVEQWWLELVTKSMVTLLAAALLLGANVGGIRSIAAGWAGQRRGWREGRNITW